MQLNTTGLVRGCFIGCLILMLWNYYTGYSNSIHWEVTTTANLVESPSWSLETDLMTHQITCEKSVLEERYSGGRIQRRLYQDQFYLGLIWAALCLLLAASSGFNRYAFFVAIAGFAVLINRLNLSEVGLFGIHHKMVMLFPFLGLSLPLFYFHEYNRGMSLALRFVILLGISAGFLLGVGDATAFTDHFIAHSLFSFSILVLLFLFLVSEEIVYAFLYVSTSVRGGKNNHLHFIALSLIYVSNLVLYYLNKSGIFKNSFSFFDPYILLAATCLIALWSFKFKGTLFHKLIPQSQLQMVLYGLGIVSFSYLSLSMSRGVDSVYESFHYFILYFHIGIGVFFLFYIISNFLDPLIKGFEIHKIAYNERNFPYATSKLGGLVIVCAFYFYSGQEAYNLLRSGYYSYLGEKERSSGNRLLADEYLRYAAYMGYNTHHANYQLAWSDWDSGKDLGAKINFFKATQRFPSPYAWINYGNIEVESNPNKVQAYYEEALRSAKSPEMENNLALIYLSKGEVDQALGYLSKTKASDEWNQAPLLNKWNIFQRISFIDSANLRSDYSEGNYGVKANILTALNNFDELAFETTELDSAAVLHRQAYLLNASWVFNHDSIPVYLKKEISKTTDASTYNRLSKALALYLYKMSEVNEAFLVLDNIQASSYGYFKGQYLDALAKFALGQGAYQLADDYFIKAIHEGFESARLSRIEALAALGKNEAVIKELLVIIEQNPSLTNFGNELLAKIKDYRLQKLNYPEVSFDSLSANEVLALANKNAFNEKLVLNAYQELKKRGEDGGYQLLVEAIEINPYAVDLRKAYVQAALDWNLFEYAERALENLAELMKPEEYNEFTRSYQEEKRRKEADEW